MDSLSLQCLRRGESIFLFFLYEQIHTNTHIWTDAMVAAFGRQQLNYHSVDSDYSIHLVY